MLTNALNDEILLKGEGHTCINSVGRKSCSNMARSAKTLQALGDLDLLVVIDHRMTATAQLADYVIALTPT